MPKIKYSKKPLVISDQIDLLKSRGLIFPDESKAEHILSYISYYRLSAYWYPMLELPKSNHIFKCNANFDDAFRLYCFDKDLRKIIYNEIEKIEIAFRTKIIYNCSLYLSPLWYIEENNFGNKKLFEEILSSNKKDYQNSDELFVKAFKQKYEDEYPPSWIMLEIISFGTLSKLFKI